MPSSTAIAFRALIMLVFLISVPLLAIFGKDLPVVVKGLLDGRLSVQLTEQPKNGNAAPGSSPAATGTGISTANTASNTALPNNSPNPFAEAAPYRATAAAASSPASSVKPATPNPISPPPAAETAFPLPAMNAGLSVPAGTQMQPPADWPAAPSHPEVFQPPVDSRPIGTELATGSGESSYTATLGSHQNNTNNDNKFRSAETRLRELGATHYVLETWGPQNERYRFACRMAIGGNVGVNRHFEAVDQDPWRAMEDVLRQVEQWQKQAVQ